MRPGPLGALILPLLALAASVRIDRIAASVNDTAIPESELQRTMVLSGLSAGAAESENSFRRRVLDMLIDQYLQYQDALRFGPAPPDAAQIQEALEKIRERLRAEGRDPDAEFARAGWRKEEVQASVERQLIVQRYLQERFAPIAFADEERARQEYERFFVPEMQAQGRPVPAFPDVEEAMRRRSEERVFGEEVVRWTRELRERARVAVYSIPEMPAPDRTRVVISTTPAAAPTATPAPAPSPGASASAGRPARAGARGTPTGRPSSRC